MFIRDSEVKFRLTLGNKIKPYLRDNLMDYGLKK